MPLKKNSSRRAKDTDLFTLFKAHMGKDLHLVRIRLICLFITALCKAKSVNFLKVAAAFDSPSLASSCMRRIQRFMAEVELPMKLISLFIFKSLPIKGKLILVMDRTNWKFGNSNINILMLGIAYRNVAIPLLFKMLDKRGNSSTQERIDLMQDFIDWFGAEQKYYFENLGIRNALWGYRLQDLGKLMENCVHNHLLAHSYKIHVGVLGANEIDIVAEKNGEKLYVQVALSLLEEKTIEREFGNLQKINDNYPKMVVTMDEFSGNTVEGILSIDLRSFLSKKW